MRTAWLIARWSLRDLRRRWPMIAITALILAVGSGGYAGFSSASTWSTSANSASLALLRMHDLRLALGSGVTVAAGTLRSVVESIPSSDAIAALDERLIEPVEVDASTASRTILVPGSLVGIDVAGGQPAVDRVTAVTGRGLGASDSGQETAMLERNFAEYYGLPAAGDVRVSGGRTLRYVGTASAPEYFIIVGASGVATHAQGEFAVVFVSLATAQTLTRQPGRVNDLVLTLKPGSDTASVSREIQAAAAARLSDVPVTVTTRDQDPSNRILSQSIDADQQFWTVLALLILVGAAVSVYNLSNRMVEAQRRELGIGMALGAGPALLAVRPLLVGIEVGVMGAIGGVAVGLIAGAWMGDQLQAQTPLPVWSTPFQPGTFAVAAGIGLLVCLAAVSWPVWRAVRARPVDTITMGHLAPHSAGAVKLARRLPLRGRVMTQIPLRNLLRTPWRTLLTAAGIGAALGSLVTVVALLDTFNQTLDRGVQEITRGTADQLAVQLDRAYPVTSAQLDAVSRSPAVAAPELMLAVPATVAHGSCSVSLTVEALDFATASWTPTVTPRAAVPDGIVLGEKAERDLGVATGDTVTLRYSIPVNGSQVRQVSASLRVAGTHPIPTRTIAFLDDSQLDRLGLGGLANLVRLRPAAGETMDASERSVAALPGVVSVQPVDAITHSFRDTIDRYTGILLIAEIAVVLIALFIAVNASSVSLEELRREHATMLSFGVRPRTILGTVVAESAVVGALGTCLGLAAGFMLLRWIVDAIVPDVMPDIGMSPILSGSTVLIAVAAGIAAVTLAPVLGIRSLRRMDVASALRIVE